MHPFDGDGMAGKPSDRSKTSKLPIESHPAEEVYPHADKLYGIRYGSAFKLRIHESMR